jgi:hypothetical protein
MVATTALVLAAGCGGKSYEIRLNKTIEQMRYNKRLDENLMPPAKGKLEQLLIYLRPPRSLDEAKEFSIPLADPGMFDLTDTINTKGKPPALHVLARVKQPKGAAKKKEAQPETAARGDFTTDVMNLLASYYSLDLESVKPKEEKKKKNTFRHATLPAEGKNVQVYFYGGKENPYEVALVFDYAKSEQSSLVPKIELSLESMAVGERARLLFSGAGADEESGEAAGGAAAF